MSQISRGPRRPVLAPNAIDDPSAETAYTSVLSRNLTGARPKTETTQALTSWDSVGVAVTDGWEFAMNLVLSGNHAPRSQSILSLAGTSGCGMGRTSPVLISLR